MYYLNDDKWYGKKTDTTTNTESYALTSDTTFISGKVYYTRSGNEGSYVYAEATVTTGGSVTASTYYEKTVTTNTTHTYSNDTHIVDSDPEGDSTSAKLDFATDNYISEYGKSANYLNVINK